MKTISIVNMETGQTETVLTNSTVEVGDFCCFENGDLVPLADKNPAKTKTTVFRRIWGPRAPSVHIDTSFRE